MFSWRGRDYTWARDEIARLDPAKDYDRIARLDAEVRFGSPALAAAFYTVTFVRQAAVPSIAKILYRGGGGPTIIDGRKRNDDTLVIFGELFANGARSARGGATIDRLQEIHGLFPITQDDYRYTLCSIIDEPVQSAERLGYDAQTPKEHEARFRFWIDVGERMGITDLPETYEAALAYARDYEAEHWAPTKEGIAVANAVIDDYVRRFVARPLQPLATRAFKALLGPPLREAHDFPDPNPVLEFIVVQGLASYLRLARFLPDPPLRSVTESFGQEYGGACPHLPDVGYKPPRDRATARAATAADAPTPGCPVHAADGAARAGQ